MADDIVLNELRNLVEKNDTKSVRRVYGDKGALENNVNGPPTIWEVIDIDKQQDTSDGNASNNASQSIQKHQIDLIDKDGEFYSYEQWCVARLAKWINKLSCTRRERVLLPFGIICILAGIAVFVNVCCISFRSTEWKSHGPTRKITRIVVIFTHYIVLPTVSVIMTWMIYYRKKESSGSGGCCACNYTIACSVFRAKDYPKGDTIPQISVDIIEPDKESNSEKSTDAKETFCNFGYFGLVLLNVLVPLFYFASGSLFFGTSIKQLVVDASRKTTTNFTNKDLIMDRTYSGFLISFYVLNSILMLPLLAYTINVYLNVMYRSAWLEQLLMKTKEPNQRRKVIKRILRFFQSPDDELERKLSYVNTFSSIYIVDVVLFDTAYILYLFMKESFRDGYRWAAIACLGASAVLLLAVMVITNYHIDTLKKSTLLLPIVQRIPNLTKNQSSNETRTRSTTQQDQEPSELDNVKSLQTVINFFDPYMTVLGYVPHLTTLIILIVTQVITYLVPSILAAHGVIKPEKLTYTHLEMF